MKTYVEGQLDQNEWFRTKIKYNGSELRFEKNRPYMQKQSH